MLVSLKKFGIDVAVNPDYVTSLEPCRIKVYTPGVPDREGVELWVVAHAGYGTTSHRMYETTVEAVRRYLNREERKHTKVRISDGA